METTHAKNGIRKGKKQQQGGDNVADETIEKIGELGEQVETRVHDAQEMLMERVETARDIVEEIRDRAELLIQERPYIVPMAAGALGVGVGVLIGSKLSRVLLFATAGALLSDTVRTQVVKMGKQALADFSEKLNEGEDVEATTGDEEPSVV